MGCVNSVGLAQYVHRKILLSPSPLLGGLPAEREWRKDIAFPSRELCSEYWKVYLDNLHAFLIKDMASPCELLLDATS